MLCLYGFSISLFLYLCIPEIRRCLSEKKDFSCCKDQCEKGYFLFVCFTMGHKTLSQKLYSVCSNYLKENYSYWTERRAKENIKNALNRLDMTSQNYVLPFYFGGNVSLMTILKFIPVYAVNTLFLELGGNVQYKSTY